MAEIHRKVELQEADDLRYLVTNVRRAANQKIDLALPPIEGEDALRQKVEELVHAYITKTFTLAAPNAVINGHPIPVDSSLLSPSGADQAVPEVQEEYEPFSDALRDRAAKLLQQEEELLVELGQLRREAPAKAAAAWREELAKDEAMLEEIIKMEDAEKGEGDGHGHGHGHGELRIEKLERQEEVERNWRKGVEGLGRLKRELPATAARMERAKRAGEYALAER